jgi:hypothetical protein
MEDLTYKEAVERKLPVICEQIAAVLREFEQWFQEHILPVLRKACAVIALWQQQYRRMVSRGGRRLDGSARDIARGMRLAGYSKMAIARRCGVRHRDVIPLLSALTCYPSAQTEN